MMHRTNARTAPTTAPRAVVGACAASGITTIVGITGTGTTGTGMWTRAAS
ncbi:hypothetical protein [Luteimonas sp. FCS-9]|nr:hypothetical protein [Luteimonas sp. FCS-9]